MCGAGCGGDCLGCAPGVAGSSCRVARCADELAMGFVESAETDHQAEEREEHRGKQHHLDGDRAAVIYLSWGADMDSGHGARNISTGPELVSTTFKVKPGRIDTACAVTRTVACPPARVTATFGSATMSAPS